MVGWHTGADPQSRRRKLNDSIAMSFGTTGACPSLRSSALLVWLAVSIGTTTAAPSTSEPFEDRTPDPAWKVPEVLAFVAVKKGDKVADIVGNHLTAALAQAVGPTGKVYAIETTQVAKLHPELLVGIRSLATRSPNIVVSEAPVASPLPSGLDAVVIRQNYHDLYDAHMAPVDVGVFNKQVFAALKPGGVYVVLDHAALAGSGIGATATLHRIDPARVKKDLLAAGFTLDAESSILANPSDDHTKSVFDPSVRHHTDQFLFRFKKPL
jgi:predicted methyltransferase